MKLIELKYQKKYILSFLLKTFSDTFKNTAKICILKIKVLLKPPALLKAWRWHLLFPEAGRHFGALYSLKFSSSFIKARCALSSPTILSSSPEPVTWHHPLSSVISGQNHLKKQLLFKCWGGTQWISNTFTWVESKCR